MSQVQRAFLKSPIGYIDIEGSEAGIRSLYFLDFKVKVGRTPSCLKACVDQLDEYFAGTRPSFDLRLDLQGTPFQQKIWQELLNIPYGTTTTYLELARRTGNIHALRAIGGANGRNPVSIIVPCHRVIGQSGKLVGYRGGLQRKKWLLEHEHAFAQRDLFYGKL